MFRVKSKTSSYNLLIFIHVIIAVVIFVIPFLSKLYALLIALVGTIIIVKSKNKNNEVLFVSAYLVGAEVFLRMTGGNFNNEYAKFCVVGFMFLGMIYSNFSKSALIYLFFFMLLIPSILITVNYQNIAIDVKKVLFFNLSGSVCLAICSIYAFGRKITLDNLQKLLLVMGFPIISTTVYLFLYTPNIQDVITGTQSNFETSGGFGPNQVSTILGLGMFIFFTQMILFSKTKIELLINGGLLIFVSYRGIVTFSRGGIITGVVMIICLLFLLYYFSNAKGRSKFALVFVLTITLGIGIWVYSSFQTRGLIEKRYANKDAIGREKKDRLGGREQIMDADIALFLDNPVFGVGAGLSKEKRADQLGVEIASHNEVTRLFSEHGLMGIFALLIIGVTPFVFYIENKQHLYFLSFYFFWLLTINHAALRTAAPAFVYALSLLFVQVKIPEETEN
nr:O-antigen ligase family protein [Flavobacterium tagetis]